MYTTQRERTARARRPQGAAAAIDELERRAAGARDAGRRAADAAERSAEAEAQRARAASELATAASAHDDALPGLLEDLGKARLAIARAQELGALETDRDRRREALARRDEALAALRASVTRAAGELERAQAGARDAERRLEELRVREGERARVMAELAVAELAAAEQAVVAAIQREREAAAARLAEREAALAAGERRASELEAALGELAAAARARAVDADRAASELARAGKALDEARRSAAAAELADKLRDGDPCPVCGACEHPGADHLGATIAVDACERTLDAARRMAKAAERERDEAERAVAAQDEALRAAAVRAGEEAQALEAARRELAAFDAPAARGKKRGRAAAGAEAGPPETPAIAMARAQARKHAERVELAFAGLDAAERERCLARGKAEGVAAVEAAAHALLRRGRDAEAVEQKLREARARAERLAAERTAAESTLAAAAHDRVEEAAAVAAVAGLADQRRAELAALVGAEHARDPDAWARSLEDRRKRLAGAKDTARARAEALAAAAERLALEARAAASRREQADAEAARARQAADEAITRAGFAGPDELHAARMEPRALEAMAAALDLLEAEVARRRAVLDERARDVDVEVRADETLAGEQARDALRVAAGQAAEAASAAQTREAELARRRQRSAELSARIAELEPRARRLGAIRQVVASKQLAEAAAERHLEAVTRAASALLLSLSGQRYSLVRTADGGFAVADADGGGVVRAPSTLSGGETFLVSLALALALSERIQLAGRTRFDFFFLDEGFGSLDPATLDVALSALERLRGPHRVIGMISHVGSIEERMPRKLRVTPARPGRAASVLHEP